MEPVRWWRRSDYSITDGRNVISKLLVEGVPGYLLWRFDEAKGRAVLRPGDPCFDTAEQAMEAAG